MIVRPIDSADATSGDAWTDLSLLTRHIVETHHAYVRGALPRIAAGLQQAAAQPGVTRQEWVQIRDIFAALGDELLTHMTKEEQILFPYIDELADAHREGTAPPQNPFGSVANPVRMMEDDHEEALLQMQRLRELTRGYAVPTDGPTDLRHCMADLAAFDSDLQRHTTIENTVLFPRALDLENGMG